MFDRNDWRRSIKTYGKNNLTKEAYEKLYEAHKSVLEATEKLPIEHDKAVCIKLIHLD